jgi:hypothetical protein
MRSAERPTLDHAVVAAPARWRAGDGRVCSTREGQVEALVTPHVGGPDVTARPFFLLHEKQFSRIPPPFDLRSVDSRRNPPLWVSDVHMGHPILDHQVPFPTL